MMTPFGIDGGTHDTRTEEGSFPTTLTLDGGSSGTASKNYIQRKYNSRAITLDGKIKFPMTGQPYYPSNFLN